MRPLRVLVVDDSTVIRRLVSEALASDPQLEVAGTAPNGKIALEKLPQLAPDAVTLDIEMPVLDGLATLPLLRRAYPRLPVVMFSTLTQKGAADTLQALALGASDYVAKPSNVGGVTAGIAAVREQLIPKLKALCPGLVPTLPAPAASGAPPVAGPRRPGGKVSLVAIGVSTGGPNALAELIPRLPADFPVPVVVVQHMPPVFTQCLAARLDGLSALTVREAVEGELLHPGGVWIAPGDFHLALASTPRGWVTRLNREPPENSCRPAVDVLFRSAAEAARGETLGVVLTGMGQDGLRGAQAIRAAGGRVLAQDQATSVVWGMPGAVAKAGLADQLLPLNRVADELVRLTRRPALAAARM